MTAGTPVAWLPRAKLAKVLGLIDSPVAGEAVAAAHVAAEMVRRSGLSWEQVLIPARRAPAALECDIGDKRNLIQVCYENSAALADWEVGFVAAADRQQQPLGPIQTALLGYIAAKAARAARAAPATPTRPPKPRKSRRSRRKRAA
jgi:hypothetical protein